MDGTNRMNERIEALMTYAYHINDFMTKLYDHFL